MWTVVLLGPPNRPQLGRVATTRSLWIDARRDVPPAIGTAFVLPLTLVHESAKSHPTCESAVAYVAIPGGDLLWQPREPVWPVPFCTAHLFEALTCVREAFDPKP